MIGFLFFAHSYSVYGKFLPPYYSATKLQFDTDLFFTALTGNLISPARGLFVWSSIFLFIFLGIYYKYKEEKIDPIYHSIIIIILFHWIAISTFPHWWAGHSVGYRFMSDMVPYLFIFLIPIVRRVFEHRSMSLTICFLLASLISFYFHYQGANNSEIALWNVIPENVDEFPSRLWDWKDPQPLRSDKIRKLLSQ